MNDNQVKAVMIAVAIVVALIAAVKIRRGLRRFFNSAEVRLVRELGPQRAEWGIAAGRIRPNPWWHDQHLSASDSAGFSGI